MNKLTPKNAKQKHMIQIVLAKMQGLEVEVQRPDGGWSTSTHDVMSIDLVYRIKSYELPVVKEIWAAIDKKWKWAAMDKDGVIYFYKDEPCIFGDNNFWSTGDDIYHESILAINTDGIDWRKSLTRRPEGV